MDSSASDPFPDGDPERPDESRESQRRSRSGRHPSRRHSSRRHSSRRRSHREGSESPSPPDNPPQGLTGGFPRIAGDLSTPAEGASAEDHASPEGDNSSGSSERRKKRRRSKRKVEEREFRPYTRPKSRHHESQIDNTLKAWSFSLRANFSWLRRRLKRGFRSRRKRRSVAEIVKPRRRTNFRIIAFTAMAIGLAAVLVPQWRERQLRLATASMLTKAKGLQAEQKFRDAALAANEFVKLRPNSVEGNAVLAHCYGLVAATSTEKEQAAEFFSKALSLDSENIELRRQFAAFLFDGEFDDRYKRAEGQAEKILAVDNNDAPAWRILGLSLFQQSRGEGGPAINRVIEALKSAVSHNPTDAQLATVLARVYRSDIAELYAGERQSLADEVMDYLVQSAPQSPDALLARYVYRLRYSVPGADADLDQALSLAPDNDRVLVAAGERALLRGRYVDARGPFLRLLSISTADRRAFLGIGQSHLALGEATEAVELLERGRREAGVRDVEVSILLARALVDAGDLSRATDVLAEAEPLVGNVPAFDEKAANAQYEEAQVRRAALLFARAKLAFAQFEYAAAVSLLKETQLAMSALAVDSPLLTSPLSAAPAAAQVTQLLADCYSAQGLPEQAAVAFNELRTHDPKNPALPLAAARAWIVAGRTDRALLALDEAGTLGDSPDTWLQVAKAHLEIQAALPADQRRWEACEAALEQAKKSGRTTPALLIAEAELLRQQDAGGPALALIEQARTLAPSAPDVLQALLAAHAAAGRFSEATAALDAFENQHGRSDETLSARVQLTAAQGDYPAAIERLRELRATTPSGKRMPRSLQLVRLQLEAGQVDGARRLLKELSDESPKNKRLMILAANLAILARDAADLAEWQTRIETLEGPDGLDGRLLHARRLLLESPAGPPPAEAEKLYAEIRERGGETQAVYVLQGLLAERRGALLAASDAYRQALRLGDQEQTAYRQLFGLLARDGRVLELLDLVQRMSRTPSSWQFGNDLESRDDFNGVLMSTALPTAADDVRRHPDDQLRGAWLAQLLALAGRGEDSRRTIAAVWKESRGALEIATSALALAAYQHDKALLKAVAVRLERNDALPAPRRAFLLGQAQQLAGDDAAAEAHYRTALDGAGDDRSVAGTSAKFFVGRDRTTVMTALTEALGDSSSPADPRRAVMRILADHGQAPEWRSAWERIFQRPADDPATDVGDVYSTVVQHVQRGGPEELDRAAESLANRVDRDPSLHRDASLADDRYLLASLYEARGRLKDAREQFVRLLAEHDDQPLYVGGYVEMLLRYNNLDEAGAWLDTLHSLAPDNSETVALEARLLGLQGRADEIEPLVERHVQTLLDGARDERARRRALVFAADAYASVGNPGAAERALRKLNDLGPDAYEPLCRWLVAQGRAGEALKLCLQAGGETPAAAHVMALARLVCDGRVLSGDYQQAAPTLEKAAQAFAEDASVLSTAAHAARYHSDGALAGKLYRAALALQPDHVETLASLAVVLSGEESTAAEAEQLIDRAKTQSGASAVVLDAQGQVLLNLRRAAEAIEVLQQASDRSSASSAALLHLATAQFRQGNFTAARAALARAKGLGLNRNALLPLDRQALNDLERAVGGK